MWPGKPAEQDRMAAVEALSPPLSPHGWHPTVAPRPCRWRARGKGTTHTSSATHRYFHDDAAQGVPTGTPRAAKSGHSPPQVASTSTQLLQRAPRPSTARDGRSPQRDARRRFLRRGGARVPRYDGAGPRGVGVRQQRRPLRDGGDGASTTELIP